jgi:hydrogenase nickel incorporation protein HypB
VGQPVLDLNQQLAGENARFFQERGILCLNLLSSPGSGKTTLLELLLGKLGSDMNVAVIEGDQQTHFDAARIRKVTSNVTQINTNRGCHLDAHMVHHALQKLNLQDLDVLFVENVGNLVCPSMFDLGESKKVVILSVTEGDDKPLKYPNAFFESELAIISKVDLLPYVDFDSARCEEYIRRVNPGTEILHFSAKTGEGLSDLIAWLNAEVAAIRPEPVARQAR